jgi:hypothetical protein
MTSLPSTLLARLCCRFFACKTRSNRRGQQAEVRYDDLNLISSSPPLHTAKGLPVQAALLQTAVNYVITYLKPLGIGQLDPFLGLAENVSFRQRHHCLRSALLCNDGDLDMMAYSTQRMRVNGPLRSPRLRQYPALWKAGQKIVRRSRAVDVIRVLKMGMKALQKLIPNVGLGVGGG